MSSAMIRSAGGSRDIVSTQRRSGLVLSGIIQNTMANSPKAVHMKSLENLVANTTGVSRGEPVMEGVIAATVPAHMRDTPELHPVPKHEVGKTDSKMSVGGPYSGPKSGYGTGGGHAEKKMSRKKY
jgi:hypothetical protein